MPPLLAAFTLIYLMSMALLIGAELNEIVARRAGVVQQSRTRASGKVTLRRVFRR